MRAKNNVKSRAGFGKTLLASYDEVVPRVEEALKQEGFGVLTRIDVRETLKAKLDVDHPRYVILGACNPPLAHRALTADPDVGLMLPCNVVVRDIGGGKTRVEMANPEAMVQLFPDAGIEGVADEANDRLRRALEKI